jgi:hypothetical protein
MEVIELLLLLLLVLLLFRRICCLARSMLARLGMYRSPDTFVHGFNAASFCSFLRSHRGSTLVWMDLFASLNDVSSKFS